MPPSPDPGRQRRVDPLLCFVAAVIAVTTALVLEMTHLGAAPEADRRFAAATLVTLFFLASPLVAVAGFLLAVLWSPGDRHWSRRRIYQPLIMLPLFNWLGRHLAEGGGVQRSGFSFLVRIGVPIAAFVGVYAAQSVAVVIARRGRWALALAALFAGGLMHELNRRVLPGLYREVHEVLFVFELLAFHLAAVNMMVASGLARRVQIGIVVIASIGIVSGAVSTIEVRARSVIERHGFHAARLLKYRDKFFGVEPARDDGSADVDDEDLLGRIERWPMSVERAEKRFVESVPERERLNFLLISVDTLRPDRIGAHRKDRANSLTPHIDALADSGIYCERAYAQYPSTHFSVESLFLGRYPSATPLYRAIKGTSDAEDRPRLLPEVMRVNGFTNVAAIAFTEEWMSQELFRSLLSHFDAVNPGRRGHPSYDGSHFVDVAVENLPQLRDRRFFLWLHLFDPHASYEYRDGLATSDSSEGRYDGEVRYVDAQVGRVLDRLKELELDDRTVVVLLSDHGEAFGEHGGVHYHGSSLYDEQIRVPQIWRIPGIAPRRIVEPVENVDVMATASDVLGLKTREATQGLSLLPYFVGEVSEDSPEFAYAELPDDVQELSKGSSELAMFVEGQWKLIRHLKSGFDELYDLSSDPGELRDLAFEDPARAALMRRRLMTIRRRSLAFGRKADPAVLRAELVAKTKTILESDDPIVRAAGVAAVFESRLTELTGVVASLLEDAGELGELRCDVLETLNALDPALATKLANTELARAEDLVPQWTALTVLSGRDSAAFDRALAALPTDSPLSRLGRMIVATDQIAPGDSRGAALRRLDKASWWRRFSTDVTWFDRALVAVRDRYLDPEIKGVVLDHLDAWPPEVARALMMHLLAGWDPDFHRRAIESASKQFGDAETRALAAAKARENDAHELAQSKAWDKAAAAMIDACELLPPASGQVRLLLDALPFALAAEDKSLAPSVLERAVTEIERVKTRVAAPYYHAVAREIEAYRSYRLEDGPLSERLDIRVTGLSYDSVASSELSPKELLPILVKLENRADRALLGGAGPLGGRVRVVWREVGAKDDLYGTEAVLARSLLPGENAEQVLLVEAPDRPGEYKGRIIVSQQSGARFHWVETAEADFVVRVVDPAAPSRPRTFDAARIQRSFVAESRIDDIGVADFDGSPRAAYVMLGYSRGIVSPVLVGDGELLRVTVRGAWLSDIPGNDVAAIALVAADDPARILGTYEATWKSDGSASEVSAEFSRVNGPFHLRLLFGPRQGILQLSAVEIR